MKGFTGSGVVWFLVATGVAGYFVIEKIGSQNAIVVGIGLSWLIVFILGMLTQQSMSKATRMQDIEMRKTTSKLDIENARQTTAQVKAQAAQDVLGARVHTQEQMAMMAQLKASMKVQFDAQKRVEELKAQRRIEAMETRMKGVTETIDQEPAGVFDMAEQDDYVYEEQEQW